VTETQSLSFVSVSYALDLGAVEETGDHLQNSVRLPNLSTIRILISTDMVPTVVWTAAKISDHCRNFLRKVVLTIEHQRHVAAGTKAPKNYDEEVCDAIDLGTLLVDDL